MIGVLAGPRGSGKDEEHTLAHCGRDFFALLVERSRMTLDSWLVARLARELDVMLRGARIQSVQTLRHGVIFLCYRRGVHIALHARLDSSDPMVGAYECARPEKESGPAGWLGDVAALLRGASIERSAWCRTIA